MKLKRILTLCAMAATLALGASSLMAQDNGGGGGGNGGGGNGGQGGFGGGGPGGGRQRNFDPAQMQQRIMDGIQQNLGFTNDTDWDAVKPLVQKVLDARRDVGNPSFRALFQRNRGGGQGNQQRGGGPGGMFGGQPSAEETALQNALDSNAPAGQVKDLLAKYKASQQAKQDKLVAAQEDLKKVLTSKQEAQAYMWGLVD
jgi:hypothetical protein